MTPPDEAAMATDSDAAEWRKWLGEPLGEQRYGTGTKRAMDRLLRDRETLLGLLAESRRIMPILHMNYCPEAHQGGECDCGGDARAKWGDAVRKALKEAGRDV